MSIDTTMKSKVNWQVARPSGKVHTVIDPVTTCSIYPAMSGSVNHQI